MASSAELIEKFSKLPIQHKVLGFVFVSLFAGVLFYFMFYSELMEKETAHTTKIKQLQDEKVEYEGKKRKYLAFRGEVSKLLEKQKELTKVLPTKSEIHSLLQSIHAQAELSGLNILTFAQQPEIRQQYYAQIPVRLIISGSFHHVNKFFYSVGRLKRIVNIQHLTLKKLKTKGTKPMLRASFRASTFRFIAAKPPPPPPPKKPAAGGH